MKNLNKILFVIVCCFLSIPTLNARRWEINPEGGIVWYVKDSHYDHIEMGGKQLAVIFRYGVDEKGRFEINKGMVWPMLRVIPNDTYGGLRRRFNWNPLDAVTINSHAIIHEKVESVIIDGELIVNSIISPPSGVPIRLKRIFVPSTEHPVLIEKYEFTNIGEEKVRLEIPYNSTLIVPDSSECVYGKYVIEFSIQGEGSFLLNSGESCTFTARIGAYKAMDKRFVLDVQQEREKCKQLISEWKTNLVLETPDPVINKMFEFSKIRACESIYETKGGPMHGPGGETYYAAIWANDQAEYINPYFPFVGYEYGNLSALNSFHHFARFMNEEWKPIPSSIIAEGDGFWNGAGDRGDAAMIANGAARYALARGDQEEAQQLWPLIEWCLEFCNRNLNDSGVVASDSDELENRFPAGEANLCTSTLYYDALISAAYLAEELKKKPDISRLYRKQAKSLEENIENYFGGEVEGYNTYAYYKGNDILRSWICMPLTVGINRRATETIEALFSPRLWTNNGLLTQAGSDTFWDRSTLYALRGVFMAGEKTKALEYLKHYSVTRLLGDHVPYAIEAWPEGDQRHLSAESALYGRIITEGMFGIRPIGFNSFSLTPRLPEEWNEMALRNIRAFGADFDIEVKREKPDMLRIVVRNKDKVVMTKRMKEGDSLNCSL